MRLLRHVATTLAMLIVLAAPVVAQDANAISQALTGTFTGTFRWEGTPDAQRVSFTFGPASLRPNGRIAARGRGIYDVGGRITTIDVECQIDPNSLLFEMWELDPQGQSSQTFVTDGSHLGAMSSDLRSISSVWTTRTTGQRGILSLSAR